jgi:outer membrane protein TolC
MYRTDNLNNLVNPGHNLWSIGVTASMPLFDGFATKAKVDEARARYNQARLQKDDFVDTLAVDVRTACLDLRKAYALIDAQTDSVGEAAEALRLSMVRFANGVGINLDVFDSEVSLAQVKQNLAQATYDSIMAKAQIDRLRGREYGGDLWQ